MHMNDIVQVVLQLRSKGKARHFLPIYMYMHTLHKSAEGTV